MPADVARGHGGDGGGDDRPPPYQREYGIRLMLAPRSAKALQEKVLLNVEGIRKLPGSPSLDGILFWIIPELSSIRKADEIC
nr:hypothetical protein [Tanacetum cinerariifolium]